MAKAVQILDKKGFTYNSDGSTYYRIEKFSGVRQALAHRFSGVRARGPCRRG